MLLLPLWAFVASSRVNFTSFIDTENPSNTTKDDFIVTQATSFDPTMGSSSGDYIRIKEMKTHSLRDPFRFT
jgi:hypothetical protein